MEIIELIPEFDSFLSEQLKKRDLLIQNSLQNINQNN